MSQYDNIDDQFERVFMALFFNPGYGVELQGDEGTPVPAPTDVYRVEMPDGRGPFNTNSAPDRWALYNYLTRTEKGWPGWLLTFPQFKREKMGVTEVAFYNKHGGALYGCSSLAALNTWFPAPSRSYLEPLGAKIIQYQVPTGEPIVSMPDLAGECIFNPKTAKRITELPITLEIKDAPLL